MATKNAQSIAPSRLAGALLSAEQIALAKIVPIERIADERNIRLRGNIERVGPCPVCGGDDRFAINIKKQLWNCRGCETGGDVVRLVQFLDGGGFREAVAMLIGERHVPVKSKNFLDLPGHKPNAAHDARSRRFALALWRQAGPPDRTPVEVYLNRRCLRPPSPDVIRFHGRCPFGKSADEPDRDQLEIFADAKFALARCLR